MLPLFAFACLARPGCSLGIALNVTPHGGAAELIRAVKEVRALGCDILPMSVKWSSLDNGPALTLDKFKSDLTGSVSAGFSPVVTLQTIDTNNRTLPKDLMSEPFDSPKMLQREDRLLKAIVEVLPEKTRALMLGNEVDVYLAEHPSETDAYARFLRHGMETVRRERAGLPVGVTTTYTGYRRDPKLSEKLQQGCDLLSMTYYPLAGDFSVLPVADVARHFDEMAAFAGQRPLFVQEAGYPASRLLGSSDAKQADFVDALFDAMTKHRSRLLGVCYFILLDFSDEFVHQLESYYGLSDGRFGAYLGTLGLKKQDGSPRPGWAEFEKRAKEFTGK